jgi:hypothetical protein
MISGASEEELELANVIADKLLLQKENQQLKQINEEHKKLNGELMVENQELKKQLDDANEKILLLQASEPMLNYKKALEETQQKEFIKYLEDKKISPIKCVLNSIDDKNHDYNMFKNKLDNYEEILQKYREIIGE